MVAGDRDHLALGHALATPAVSGYRIQILRIPHQDWFAEDFRVLLELLRAGEIHPVVAERLPFTEARRAHELLERSAAKGKLVLVPQPGEDPR